jgi:hypothetical protein
MCFDQKTSFGFAALGFYLAYYVHTRTSNTRLAIGVFWFFLMELLQGFQYFWIDQCQHPVNKILTLAGFIHICYQPYFTHIINSSLSRNPRILDQYTVILRLCLVGGTMLFARYFLAPWASNPTTSHYTDWANLTAPEGHCRTQEWIRGEELCTYKGKYHLAWSVPFYDVTYWWPSPAIHSFLMFAPFFVMKWNMVIQGIFLWATGPYLASWITPNLQEQASIWCFFSICQIGIMLLVIREHLVIVWGKTKTSVHETHTESNGHSNGHANGNGKKTAEVKATPNKARAKKD